ncbi:LuxR C-terminal-related transcriptional regulator [Streptomyces sp. NPDC004291]
MRRRRFAGGEEAAHGPVRAARPYVVLMDVRMPEVDGIRATERILAGTAEPPRIPVVTTFENDSSVYDALRAGAAGFLLERAAVEEPVGAVRPVARSDSPLYPEAVRGPAAEHARRAPWPAPPWAARLTEREAEVRRLRATGPTNAEIAARLGVGPATVKTHVAAVLSELGARARTRAVVLAYESGCVGTG